MMWRIRWGPLPSSKSGGLVSRYHLFTGNSLTLDEIACFLLLSLFFSSAFLNALLFFLDCYNSAPSRILLSLKLGVDIHFSLKSPW